MKLCMLAMCLKLRRRMRVSRLLAKVKGKMKHNYRCELLRAREFEHAKSIMEMTDATRGSLEQRF